jgi:hypothetical protein
MANEVTVRFRMNSAGLPEAVKDQLGSSKRPG